jgi:PBSX family phage portal protein
MSSDLLDSVSTQQRIIPVAKAHFIGEDGGIQSTVLAEQKESQQIFSKAGAIDPAYDPNVLALIYENASALRPNVDAYITNIDSFGHAFIPIIEVDAEEARDKVRDALRIERQRQKRDPRNATDTATLLAEDEPTDKEVDERLKLLDLEIRTERARLHTFFENCTYDMPFSGPEGLRGLTRQDIEVLGNGYWEVLRNGFNEVCQFNYIPALSIRLMALDEQVTEVEIERRVSMLSSETIKVRKRYRRYVQVSPGSGDLNILVYFKEFGDPRVLSSKSGKYYATRELMEAQDDEKGVAPATEILAFKISSPRSPYGVPRWIGTLLSVLGTRQSEEVNFLYFENRSVPPMAILVSGGRLNDKTVTRLQDYIQNNIRGKANFHKIMILEAESSDSNMQAGVMGRMKIEIKPLTEAQQSDALFQSYDERNADKVGQSFRLPRILRGDVRDFNRSCYSADTETLTENGWKKYDQIGPDEKIAAYDPKTDQICFVVPKKKLVYEVVDEEMIRFANKKTDCLVTRDHTMYVRKSTPTSVWQVLEAGQVDHLKFKVKVAGSRWEGREQTSFSLPKACEIERGHGHGISSDVKFDDWLEFLGYFLSEGGLVLTAHPSAPFLVYIDQKKPGPREKIRACLDRIGWKYSTQIKPCGTTHFLLSNRCLRDWLVDNVGHNSHDWHIPDDYLKLSSRQLHILFDAMMLGDGSVGKNGTSWSYYSASRQLVDQVQWLLLQTGYRAHIRRSEAAQVWRVCFSGGTTTQLHSTGAERTPASVTRERYTGKVYCFSVPGFGFFVTRRNGKVAIQGNTAEASIDFAEIQVFGPIRQQFDWVVNKLIFPALGMKYHHFQSNAPTVRDPEALSRMIALLTANNVLVPAEARNLAQNVFNQAFENVKDDWTKQPISVTLAQMNLESKAQDSPTQGFNEAGGMSTSNAGPTQTSAGVPQKPKTTPPDRSKPKPKSDDKLHAQAKAILLHKSLQDAAAADAEDMETVVIKVPNAEFMEWFKTD